MYKIKRLDDGSLKIEKDECFDSARYSGDKDFVLTDDFEKEYATNEPFDAWKNEDIYWRPKNIDKTIGWVKENIFSGNQQRLIDTLFLMKKEHNLYFYNSW